MTEPSPSGLPIEKPIRLTQTVQKGGCAAKLPAGTLRGLVSHFGTKINSELVVGTETLDDACLFDLGNNKLLVQTLDFFTPIVDSPKDFGAIAAANSISDIYAMGGTPKLALAILGFPLAELPLSVLEQMMQGAREKLVEAKVDLAGGHSIDDSTIKLGFSVTGFVDKNKAWTNAGAQTHDVLILTKALGTGTIASALKSDKAKPTWIDSALSSMKQLNRVPELLEEFDVHAATDITGFGLAGHALQLARASQRSISIQISAVPTLEGAMQSLVDKNWNRAHRTNREYVESETFFEDSLNEFERLLVLDAQTSGGLLLSVSEADAPQILAKIKKHFPLSATIGRVDEKTSSAATLNFRK